MDDKNETSNMIEDTNVFKPREEGPFLRSEKRDQFKEVQSVMVLTAPPSRGVRSRKRKREAEEASPSADAVSEKNLKEIAPMFLVRWKTAAYKGGSAARKLTEVMVEVEASTTPGKKKTSNLRRRMRRGAPPVDKCGKGMSGKNGSRLNTRTLVSK